MAALYYILKYMKITMCPLLIKVEILQVIIIVGPYAVPLTFNHTLALIFHVHDFFVPIIIILLFYILKAFSQAWFNIIFPQNWQPFLSTLHCQLMDDECLLMCV